MTGTLHIDHLVVSGETLSEATAYVERLLDVTLSDVGHHDFMGTHNRLLSLGPRMYLEVIAIDPDAKAPGRPRWFDLDAFSGPPRLTNWVCRTDDLDALLSIAPTGTGMPQAFTRSAFKWRMAVPEDGKLPCDGAMPALIQWDTPQHPAPLLDDVGIRLNSFEISHTYADRLLSSFSALSELESVSLKIGDAPGFVATFDTPQGPKVMR